MHYREHIVLRSIWPRSFSSMHSIPKGYCLGGPCITADPFPEKICLCFQMFDCVYRRSTDLAIRGHRKGSPATHFRKIMFVIFRCSMMSITGTLV